MKQYQYIGPFAEVINKTHKHTQLRPFVRPVLFGIPAPVDLDCLLGEVCDLYGEAHVVEFSALDKFCFFSPVNETCDEFMSRFLHTLYKSANGAFTNSYKGIVCVDLSDPVNREDELFIKTLMAYAYAHKNEIAFVFLCDSNLVGISKLYNILSAFIPIYYFVLEEKEDFAQIIDGLLSDLNISVDSEVMMRLEEYFLAHIKADGLIRTVESIRFYLETADITNDTRTITAELIEGLSE